MDSQYVAVLLSLALLFFLGALVAAFVQAPSVSPCLRCAGTALELTVMVTLGCFFECVRWQIVCFFGTVEVVPVFRSLRPPPLAILAAAKPAASRSAVTAKTHP